MPSSYPGSIDALSNPTPTSATSNPSHAEQHEDANDAIEAIEAELGTTPSGSEATVAARLTAVEAAANDAPTDATYLVGAAHAGLSAEIVVGATPSGELGGTWASPTVDSSHAGGTHAATQAAAEATASSALTTHAADTTSVHGIADLATLPLGKLGYAERTTDQTGISTVVDIASLSVTVTVGTGRRIRITGYGRLYQGTAAAVVSLHVTDASNVILNSSTCSVAADSAIQGVVMAVIAPSSGSKTYKLRAQTSAGSLTFDTDADTPGYILVEDIGAA